MEQAKREAEKQMRRQVSRLSLEIAEKVLRKDLSKDTAQVELVDRMLVSWNQLRNCNDMDEGLIARRYALAMLKVAQKVMLRKRYTKRRPSNKIIFPIPIYIRHY